MSLNKIIFKEIHGKRRDGDATLKIKVIESGDDNVLWREFFSRSEPEDATLERDLNFVYGLKDFFRLAHSLGSDGYEVQYEEENEEDAPDETL